MQQKGNRHPDQQHPALTPKDWKRTKTTKITNILYLWVHQLAYHPLPPLSIVLSTLCVCLYECVSSCMSVHDGDVSAAPSYVIRVIAAVLVWLQELKATAVLCCSDCSGCIALMSLSVPSLPFPVLSDTGQKKAHRCFDLNIIHCWCVQHYDDDFRFQQENLQLWGSAFVIQALYISLNTEIWS